MIAPARAPLFDTCLFGRIDAVSGRRQTMLDARESVLVRNGGQRRNFRASASVHPVEWSTLVGPAAVKFPGVPDFSVR
jgi:hypothetical protein